MNGSRWLDVLERLPYAERRDLAAGYAMGLVAVLAALSWYAVALALRVLGVAGPAGLDVVDLVLGGSVLVAPVAVPSAFGVATLLWRRYATPRPDPRRGAALGAATALGSLAVGALGVGALGLAFAFPGQSVTGALQTAGALAAVGFVFALAAVGWLVVPVGALAGWYHERALRRTPGDAAVRRAVE